MATTYVKQYQTRALFDSALSGGEIATLMNSVTTTNPSVAIDAYIYETGETISCGVNIMVDERGIGIGDVVLWDKTNKVFVGIANKWLDRKTASPPTQHNMVYDSTHFMGNSNNASRYVFCGWCVRRKGNKIRIAGTPANKPWTQANSSDYAWSITGLTNYTTTVKKYGGTQPVSGFGHATYCWPSLRYQEWYYGVSAPSTAWLPVTRESWSSQLASHPTYITVTNGSGTSVNINPADYGYSYDRFMNTIYQPRVPAAEGALADADGRANTRAIYDWLTTNKSASIANASAAGYCWNYAVSNVPGLEAHSWFLGSIRDVGEIAAFRYVWGGSWGSGYLWSSTQYSAYGAWRVGDGGGADTNVKYYEFAAVPLADLILTS